MHDTSKTSIHSPDKGRDYTDANEAAYIDISIHSPDKERDFTVDSAIEQDNNFNPLSRQGERHWFDSSTWH